MGSKGPNAHAFTCGTLEVTKGSMMNSDQLVTEDPTGNYVQYGWLPGRPRVADPLAGATGPGAFLRRTRLKEWMHLFISHPRWSSGFAMKDAKYLKSSDLHAYDWDDNVLVNHQATGGLTLPKDLLDQTARVNRPGFKLEVAFDGPSGTHQIRVDIAATKDQPSVLGKLSLHAARASAPLSVSELLPRGSMYTWKQIFPVSGRLIVGGERIDFDPSRDLAIIDEHRSSLPYVTNWKWGTFGFQGAGGIVGANVVGREQRPDQQHESAMWAQGVCEPLADVVFTATGDDPLAPWAISSSDGALQVEFTPRRRKPWVLNAGVIAVDYQMMYGSYRGTLHAAGKVHEVVDVHGPFELMHARM